MLSHERRLNFLVGKMEIVRVGSVELKITIIPKI